MAVLTGYIIKFIIINIKTKSSIRLFNKENKYIKKGLTRLNKAFI